MLHFVVGAIMHGYNTVEHSTTGANNYNLIVFVQGLVNNNVYTRSSCNRFENVCVSQFVQT